MTPTAAAREVPTFSSPRPATHAPPAGLCGHHIWGEESGLECIRSANHSGGHEYHDPSGSYGDDGRLEGGHG